MKLRPSTVALGAAVALGSGVVAGNLAMQARKPRVVHPEQFSRIASKYDAELGPSEAKLGVDAERRKLLGRATGRVLEVAAGTWRNDGAYDDARVEALVLTDASREMLDVAVGKLERSGLRCKASVAVVPVDELPAAFSAPHDKFDVVVDTFGMCSFPDPVVALRNMQQVLRDGGVLLLLEHGRVENPAQWGASVINAVLDWRAAAHSETWGCLHNRPILSAVRDAGLDVESVEFSQLSTVVSIVARKPPKVGSDF